MSVELLTWNMRRNEDERAERWLTQEILHRSRKGAFLVALQEAGDLIREVSTRVRKAGASTLYSAGDESTIGLLSNCPLTAASTTLTPRSAGLRFVHANMKIGAESISVVSYHGHARRGANPLDPAERGGAASEIRWLIDCLSAGLPRIVLGDFNSEPDGRDLEITSPHCFGFGAGIENAAWSHNRQREELQVIQPRGSGTLWLTGGGGGNGWRTPDFLAASTSLLNRLTDVKTLDELAGNALKDRDGIPSVSDHLPVHGLLSTL